MMAIDSALTILLVEALVVMLVLAIALLLIARHRRSKEMAEIDQFIDQMEMQALIKSQRLEQFLGEDCGLDPDVIGNVAAAVSDTERVLFQQIIRLFLKRELALLNDIEQQVSHLVDPYHKILVNRDELPEGTVLDEAAAVHKLVSVERVNQQLIRQLDTAMKTIDEISAEYTRVFSGNQTALELENSSKKMLKIFFEAEVDIRNRLAELEKG